MAALSLAAITGRASGARVAQLARMLAREAAELGKAMGYAGGAAPRAIGRRDKGS